MTQKLRGLIGRLCFRLASLSAMFVKCKFYAMNLSMSIWSLLQFYQE